MSVGKGVHATARERAGHAAVHAPCGERLGATPEQLFINLHKYGNTSAASVAIALDEAVTSGRVQRGDLILLVVFGAGLTWGAAVIEWPERLGDARPRDRLDIDIDADGEARIATLTPHGAWEDRDLEF